MQSHCQCFCFNFIFDFSLPCVLEVDFAEHMRGKHLNMLIERHRIRHREMFDHAGPGCLA